MRRRPKGFCFGRLSGPQTLYSHELVIPLNSTYAPWQADGEFRRAYEAVRQNTLVDVCAATSCGASSASSATCRVPFSRSGSGAVARAS